jgi:uncharacterized protein (DUF3084 family)
MKSNKFEKIFWLILISTLLLTSVCRGQIKYPRFSVDSLGQKIVELTVEQAQKLDNNSEVLILFQKLASEYRKSDSVCVKVINDKEKVITSQKVLIGNLNETVKTQNEMISTLQAEVNQHEEKAKILQLEVDNRQGVIKEKDKQIKKMKLKMIFGGGLGAAIITGLLIAVLL